MYNEETSREKQIIENFIVEKYSRYDQNNAGGLPKLKVLNYCNKNSASVSFLKSKNHTIINRFFVFIFLLFQNGRRMQRENYWPSKKIRRML